MKSYLLRKNDLYIKTELKYGDIGFIINIEKVNLSDVKLSKYQLNKLSNKDYFISLNKVSTILLNKENVLSEIIYNNSKDKKESIENFKKDNKILFI